MPEYKKVLKKYQDLTEKASQPKNSRNLKEIGQELSELKPFANLAKKILSLKKEIEENQEIASSENKDLVKLAKNELKKLKSSLKKLEQQYKNLKHQQSSPQDKKAAILEFRAAAGGDEAKIWAEELIRMYIRYAENLNLKISTIDENTIKITGKPQKSELPSGPYGIFKHESGVHRVQRVPTTESQGRIHTSTASVVALPEVEEKDIKINPADIEWQFFRSGGAGGQHVNKVSTGVRLTHKPSNITVTSTEERVQQRNREIALQLLRSKLWKIREEKRQSKLEKERKSAIGRGQRAEKIRTYNFPQNRVTDHRINKSWHNLEEILDGELSKITLALSKKL